MACCGNSSALKLTILTPDRASQKPEAIRAFPVVPTWLTQISGFSIYKQKVMALLATLAVPGLRLCEGLLKTDRCISALFCDTEDSNSVACQEKIRSFRRYVCGWQCTEFGLARRLINP